jgi:small subunit ribosomal protein S1
MTGHGPEASYQDAFEASIPVEGRVEAERKGGFEVRIGNQEAFCPYSQIDLYRKDAAVHIGQRYSFVISEYDEDGRNLVVSRRKLLERERAQLRDKLKAELQIGQVLPGTVVKLMPFGAFVDIGGIEGLIPLRELSWARGVKPEEVVSEGENVTVMVRELNWDEDKITLSLKQAQSDPWSRVTSGDEYAVGTRHTGTVTQLAPFGAFVQLAPGLEGLVHISRLGAGRRINHPQEVVATGDRVEVCIESVDAERRRIALTMESTAEPATVTPPDRGAAPQAAAQPQVEAVVEGKTFTGVVDGVRDFGVFIRLPNGDSGLLHVSQVELKGSSNPRRALFDMFKPGSSVEVVVKEIQGKRISLTIPETMAKEAASREVQDFRDTAGQELGSLGDMLNGLKL